MSCSFSGFRVSALAALMGTVALSATAYSQTVPNMREALRVPSAPGMMPHAAPFRSPRTIPGFAAPTVHTQKAHSPTEDYTSRWTRADARQIVANSNPNAASGTSSLPSRVTMPDIPADYPATNDQVWVWDTWTLIDKNANQIAFNGWEVIFCLTADRHAGYGFDDRHVHARLGYFFRRAGVPASKRPVNGGWTYGGNVFPEGASAKVGAGETFTENAQWSGSTRMLEPGTNKVQFFYTDLFFNRTSGGGNITPPDAVITTVIGQIHADLTHVWFSGLDDHKALLRPDGKYYQSGAQNEFYSFRDPFTFEDPKQPGVNYMVFEGNSSGVRGQTPCNAADLGYRSGDPYAESVDQVNSSGAIYQRANIGLAVADNADMTKWHFLPPLISSNCVNDQTERPQMYIKDGKYYVFTISHRTTYAAGMDGPDGVYGFVGNAIRSDFQPMNYGSGLVLGNPTNLNIPAGTDYSPYPGQDTRTFQSYSHYVMKGGLVESFIDTINGTRGGSLAPTVKINFKGANSAIDLTYGDNGVGYYGNIPANRYDVDYDSFITDPDWPEMAKYDLVGRFGASDWPYYTALLMKSLRDGKTPLPTAAQYQGLLSVYNTLTLQQQQAVQQYIASH